MSDITLVDYSEKAIAVYGDTKEFKDEFAKIGGKWNDHLRDGKGWIYSKTKRSEVEALISRISDGVVTPVPVVPKTYSKKESKSPVSSSSSNFVVTKSEYLALMSRVERLEAEIARLTGQPLKSQPTSVIAGDDIQLEDDEKEAPVTTFKKKTVTKKSSDEDSGELKKKSTRNKKSSDSDEDEKEAPDELPVKKFKKKTNK